MRFTILLIIFLCLDFYSIQSTLTKSYNPDKIHNNKDINIAEQNTSSMDNYDVKFYRLDLEVSDTSTYISGSATVLVEVVGEPLNIFILELLDVYTIDSVLVDEVNTDFSHQNNEISIYSLSNHEINSLVNIRIFYSGSVNGGFSNSGMFNKESIQLGKNITWTLSEPFYSKNWFPCKQVLTDKADSVYVFVTTDSHLKAGSNGILAAIDSLPGNKLRYEWKSRYPIAYYLISIAVGDYTDYSFYVKTDGESDSILIQNYLYNSEEYIKQIKNDVDKTSDLLKLYSDLFGQYPFAEEKYGHTITPIGGGMEHQTMTTLGNFAFGLVAHELAHQWFGDNVTCATWQDIWINEGFASYSEYLADEYLISWDKARLWMAETHEFIMSEPGGSVYIPSGDTDNHRRIFDNRLSYKKGAAIIHMIRHEVQDDSLFFDILREFQTSFKDSVATGMDFKLLLEGKTGKEFTAFFNQWYFGEGYPTIDISWDVSDDTLTINSLQTTSSLITPLFNTLTEFKIAFMDGDTSILFRQQSNYDQYKIHVDRKVTGLKADPKKWLLADINIQNYINIDRKYTIAPNPAKDKLEIQFNQPVEDYSIYITDTSGKIVNN
ncbi:MAG: M1 family metallopeptidase, partial [Bacteroidales bacterium]